MRYFKKLEPRNSPVLANGSSCAFTTLDGLTGYFCDGGNEYVGTELARLTVEGRYGITEISPEEFVQDYVEPKKKGVTPRPIWREEVANSGVRGKPLLEQLGQANVERAVGVAADNAPNAPKTLRTDGPTESEYRAAGYKGTYPPEGYAPRAEGQAPVPMPAAATTVADASGKPAAPPAADLKTVSRTGRRVRKTPPEIKA